MANYNEITSSNSPNFTSGRGGNKIQSITIHWWGDPAQNPSAEGVVNWLCNPSSQVSAHLVVTGTGRRAWQIVNDQDTAWHAGNWTGNQTSIGIECDPRCRDEDYDTIGEVIADLWRYYGKLPLRGHNSWVATRCPGNYDLNRLNATAEAKLAGVPTAEEKARAQRIAAEKAALEAQAAQRAADEAKAKEKARLEAEARAAALKAQVEAEKLNKITTEQFREAMANAKETNGIVKQILKVLVDFIAKFNIFGGK